ncbi:MAG: hypothetical protein EWM73_02021 [Nitrospira sp.]|nr:MAG: hypothetical protein EWM73_02021 [Nitrospira sp.]
MTLKDTSHPVFVLGAGFTKAFMPDAPLLNDDYNIDALLEKYKGMDRAQEILSHEKVRAANGLINIERLMTRFESPMPYDREDAELQYKPLLTDVHDLFRERLRRAKMKGVAYPEYFAEFARYCVNNSATCITFNYDDVLDEALLLVQTPSPGIPIPQWHPSSGYGFFLRPSDSCIGETPWVYYFKSSTLLLKLHGSINWRIKLGYTRPYSIDSIVHHEEWTGDNEVRPRIETLLQKSPFIVPPLLTKTSLNTEQILKSIWGQAYIKLRESDLVVFVGYSLPITDLAAQFLFVESLKGKDGEVRVVNLPRGAKEQLELKVAYQKIFPRITDDQFFIEDARDWLRKFMKGVV